MNEYNSYLVPANSKKSMLILGLFRPFDLALFIIGLVISFLLIAILGTSDIVVVILSLSPLLICTFLVLPVPYYHNVLVTIQSIYRFYNSRRNFIWRGWCANEQSDNK